MEMEPLIDSKRCCQNLSSRLTSLLCFLLAGGSFGYTYYVIVFVLCKDLWESSQLLQNFLGIFFLVIFNAIFCLATVSYARSVLTSPGYTTLKDIQVFRNFFCEHFQVHFPRGVPKQDRELISSGSGNEFRFCLRCKLPKPPRGHHCSQCDRCVLRMDHHCVWINNCVGWWNYKVRVCGC